MSGLVKATEAGVTLLHPFEADPPLLDPQRWAAQQHLWWVWNRRFAIGLDWSGWTFSPTEPPLSAGQISNGYGWRHPTFEEACERQYRFNRRADGLWDRAVKPSWANSRWIDAPYAGRCLLITPSPSAEDRAADYSEDCRARRRWPRRRES